LDPKEGLLTIVSIGQCGLSEEEPTLWAFFGPLLCFHLCLVATCNLLLLKVRKLSSRYQEFKYVAIAMVLMMEVMLIGIPVLFAAKHSPAMVHVILIVAVVFHDISVLSCIFIPKVYYKDKNPTKDHGESVIIASFRRMGQSKWDDSLAVLDKLVAPGSKTRKSMTQEEVMELEEVRALLIQGLQGGAKEDKLVHLPTSLTSQLSTSMSSTVRPDNNSLQYILREYAGVKLSWSRASFRIASTAETIPEDMSTSFMSKSYTGGDYLLPEFEALPEADKKAVYEMLSWSNLKEWDFNVFELESMTGGNPLLFVGWAVMGSPYSQYAMATACGLDVMLPDLPGYNFVDSTLKIPMHILCDYLRVIQDDYVSSNPYHNEIHAADVVQTLHALIQMMDGVCEITDEQSFAALLAASVHDVKHPGKNNIFQVNAKTGLAILYNDVSVLENRHASHAFMRMLGKEDVTSCLGDDEWQNNDVNPLCNVSPETFQKLRGMIIEAVLHTDMSKHFHHVNAMKGLIMTDGTRNLSKESIWQTLKYMLHLADISNPAKGDPMFKVWTDRCLGEFFAQGDRESELDLPISPNCDRKVTKRAESQIGFIRYVILPAYEALALVLPKVEDILPVIQENLVFWEMDSARVIKRGASQTQPATRRITVELEEDREIPNTESARTVSFDDIPVQDESPKRPADIRMAQTKK
jgi:hypothetical protein